MECNFRNVRRNKKGRQRVRKILTLNDINKGDILEPIPGIYFKKPLLVDSKDNNFFYVKELNKKISYNKRVLKYFLKRKLKNI